MINNLSSAMNAYQQALTRINAQGAKVENTSAPKEPGFGEMVKSVIDQTVDLNKVSENLTIAGVQGKADIQDVVLAVSNAETALETVVAVRDTAIKAYNTIMQMPI